MSYCDWGKSSERNTCYHDEEWGVPLHDDRRQFEFLMLEVMQCGLSWQIIIGKRDILRRCFADFDYDKISRFTDEDVDRIMNTTGMIKSRRKIEAVIHNAVCFCKIRSEFGSFYRYIWGYSGGKTIIYDKHGDGEIPVSNGLSNKISHDLKKRGFKFLGSVTIYSHLQACGIINDHDKNCPRYKYIVANFPTISRRRYLEKQVKHF